VYYLTDGLGSTIATVNSSGVLQSSQSYDVYGAQSSGGAAPGGFGFAGEQWDSSTGLQYLRARYYDPTIGRFISRDPMSAIPGWTGSPYGYGGGNPVNMTDPTGLCPFFATPFCMTSSGIASGAGWIGSHARNVLSGAVDAVAFCSTSSDCANVIAGAGATLTFFGAVLIITEIGGPPGALAGAALTALGGQLLMIADAMNCANSLGGGAGALEACGFLVADLLLLAAGLNPIIAKIPLQYQAAINLLLAAIGLRAAAPDDPAPYNPPDQICPVNINCANY
jgi:RHS repeat-associated protein